MEIVYADNVSAPFLEGQTMGFYGDILHLSPFGIEVKGIVYDDNWTVKRFLNGRHFGMDKRISSIFTYLDIDENVLSIRLKDLSQSDFKFILLAYLLLKNKKVLIFDYFEASLNYKLQKKLLRILRNLKKDGLTIILVSKDLVFLEKIVDNMKVMNNESLVYDGNMEDLIKLNNEYIEKPEILKFIDLANKRNAHLEYTLDSNELLKDIYRSVC